MHVLLVILCVLMIIFAGGCAIMAIGFATPLAVVPAGIVLANVLVILSIAGKRKPAFAAFFTLAVLDLVVGTPMLVAAVTSSGLNIADPSEAGVLAFAIALVLKGILTLIAVGQLRQRDPQAAQDSASDATSPGDR